MRAWRLARRSRTRAAAPSSSARNASPGDAPSFACHPVPALVFEPELRPQQSARVVRDASQPGLAGDAALAFGLGFGVFARRRGGLPGARLALQRLLHLPLLRLVGALLFARIGGLLLRL